MPRKAVTEPVQDTVPTEKIDISGIVERNTKAIRAQRKEELELMIEGVRAVKQRLLANAQEKIKQYQEALEKDTAHLDALAEKYTKEYKKLLEELSDDKNS